MGGGGNTRTALTHRFISLARSNDVDFRRLLRVGDICEPHALKSASVMSRSPSESDSSSCSKALNRTSSIPFHTTAWPAFGTWATENRRNDVDDRLAEEEESLRNSSRRDDVSMSKASPSAATTLLPLASLPSAPSSLELELELEPELDPEPELSESDSVSVLVSSTKLLLFLGVAGGFFFASPPASAALARAVSFSLFFVSFSRCSLA